jgi:hypothetical protein
MVGHILFSPQEEWIKVISLTLWEDSDSERRKFNLMNVDELFPMLFRKIINIRVEVKCFLFRLYHTFECGSIFDIYFAQMRSLLKNSFSCMNFMRKHSKRQNICYDGQSTRRSQRLFFGDFSSSSG